MSAPAPLRARLGLIVRLIEIPGHGISERDLQFVTECDLRASQGGTLFSDDQAAWIDDISRRLADRLRDWADALATPAPTAAPAAIALYRRRLLGLARNGAGPAEIEALIAEAAEHGVHLDPEDTP